MEPEDAGVLKDPKTLCEQHCSSLAFVAGMQYASTNQTFPNWETGTCNAFQERTQNKNSRPPGDLRAGSREPDMQYTYKKQTFQT